MDVCRVPADRGTWHCVSMDREAPGPLGSYLSSRIDSSCCCSIPWLCPDSPAVACSHTLHRGPYHRRTEPSIMIPSIRKLLLTAHITLSVGWFGAVAVIVPVTFRLSRG